MKNCNETCHGYSLSEPHDNDDILKVIDLKVKVVDNIFRKYTLPEEAYRLIVCDRRMSSSCSFRQQTVFQQTVAFFAFFCACVAKMTVILLSQKTNVSTLYIHTCVFILLKQ